MRTHNIVWHIYCNSLLTPIATALQAPSRGKEEAIQSNFLYAGKVTLTKEELFSSAAHEICVSILIDSFEGGYVITECVKSMG